MHQLSNNDLNGVRSVNIAVNDLLHQFQVKAMQDVKGLHTLLTVIATYQGHRYIAQSIIPGTHCL